MRNIASVWPGVDWIAPALVLALLAAVIHGLFTRIGHMIDQVSSEQTNTRRRPRPRSARPMATGPTLGRPPELAAPTPTRGPRSRTQTNQSRHNER